MGELAKNPASFAQVNTMSAANAIQALSVVLDAAAFNSQDQNKLLALVQASNDDEDSGAPAAAVYKSKAGGIVDVIEDMISKLEKDFGADAEEKAWCDEQLSKTAAKKGDLEDDNDKATARIDAADAKSATLQEELQVLAGELSAL